MKHIAKSGEVRKSYASPLREAQVEETKRTILDALVRVLGRGPAELSVPAVAKQAGVSVPTVYRHFGSKRGLMKALYDSYSERIGTDWAPGQITSVEDFIEHMPTVFRRIDQMDAGMRAAMSTDLGLELRRKMMPGRLAGIERALEGDGVDGPDRERLRDIVTILTSSPVRRAFADFLDYDADETSERVAWAIRELVSAAKRKQRGKGKR